MQCWQSLNGVLQARHGSTVRRLTFASAVGGGLCDEVVARCHDDGVVGGFGSSGGISASTVVDIATRSTLAIFASGSSSCTGGDPTSLSPFAFSSIVACSCSASS